MPGRLPHNIAQHRVCGSKVLPIRNLNQGTQNFFDPNSLFSDGWQNKEKCDKISLSQLTKLIQ